LPFLYLLPLFNNYCRLKRAKDRESLQAMINEIDQLNIEVPQPQVS